MSTLEEKVFSQLFMYTLYSLCKNAGKEREGREVEKEKERERERETERDIETETEKGKLANCTCSHLDSLYYLNCYCIRLTTFFKSSFNSCM